ncbi:LIM-domain binding protein-domain-containing protein [Lipomyces orientalis]|uniref:LIM-domain binding protein-domain-containing protein n=1 Tax=Lipomyces orientalis TaxID=1233043 RepID=A0ACC3TYT3_9ASCO
MASPQPQTAPTPQPSAPTPVNMQTSQSKPGQYSAADAAMLPQQQQQQQLFQRQLQQQQQQHELTAAQQQYLLQRQQQQQHMYQLQLLRQRQQMINGVTPPPNGPQPGIAQQQIPVSQVGMPANSVGVTVPGAPGQLQHLPQNAMAAAAAAYQFQNPAAATIANLRMANPNIPQHVLQQQIQQVLANQHQQQLLQQQLQQQQHGPQGQVQQPTPQQQHAQAQLHAQAQQQGHPPGPGGQQVQQQHLPNQGQLQQQGVAQPASQQQTLQQALQPGQQQQQTQQVTSAGIPANLAAIQAASMRGKTMGMTALMRLLNFCETLSAATEQQRNLDYWRKFVTDFYTDLGGLKYTVVNAVDKVPKHYDVPNAALPRYYYTLFQDGVRRVQIVPENPREIVMGQDMHVIECGRASMIYWFSNGNHVISHGSLRVFMNATMRIDSLEFQSHDHNEFVSRAMAVAAVSAAAAPGGMSPSSNAATTAVSRSQINGYGITDSLTRFLQITQVMAQMRELVPYYLSPNNSSGPLLSFNSFVNLINAQRENSQQQQLQLQVAQQQQQINQIQLQQQLQLQQAQQHQMQMQLQMQMQQQLSDEHKDDKSKSKNDNNLSSANAFDLNEDNNLGDDDDLKFSMDNGNDSNDLSIDVVPRSGMENGPSAVASISAATSQAMLQGDTSSPMMNTPSPSQQSSGMSSPRTAANKRRRESTMNNNNNPNSNAVNPSSNLSQSSTINVDSQGNGSDLNVKEEDGDPSKTRSPPKVKQSPKITKQISNKRVKTLSGGGG